MKSNKQVFFLFLINTAVLFVGLGLFPLLPIYAARFNADNRAIGMFFAILFMANALGPVLAGWLSERISKKKLIILAAAPGIPVLALLSLATAFWQVILLSSLLWFSGGLILTLSGILNGLQQDPAHQGKTYSLLSLAAPFGSLAGGAVTGGLLAWKGFPIMFVALAIVWAAVPILTLFGLREPEQTKAAQSAQRSAAPDRQQLRLFGSPAFLILLGVSFLSSITINLGRLGTTLSMQALTFSADAVASTTMAGGLVAIPVTLLVGSLADRLGRKHFLAASYLFATGGALLQGVATHLWHFWLSSSLLLLAFGLSGAMSSAMLTEILPTRILSRALSSINAISAVANILTFAAGGYLISILGLKAIYLVIGLAAFGAALGLELFIQRPARRSAPVSCSAAAETAC